MKISYRFFDNFSNEEVTELATLGIKVNEGCDSFILYEDNAIFEKIKHFFEDRGKSDCISIDGTDFTEKERESAAYLMIGASKILGYPQPEDTYEEVEEDGEPEYPYPFDIYPYFRGVYEVSGTSHDYGMLRGKQIGSFALNGEPHWGKSSIGSVFDASDVFLTTPEVYRQIFEPLGIECKQVLGYGNRKPLGTVVQLLPQGISKSRLMVKEDQISEKTFVKEWNMTKYIFNGKGFAPAFETTPGNFDFFASQEYFGSGGVNEKELFISQRLYQLLKKNKIKGLCYYPQPT